MNNVQHSVVLHYVTSDTSYLEQSLSSPSLEEAIEDADDLAFSSVGYPLEDWKSFDLSDNHRIYWFYPNDDDRTSRYKLTISPSEEA